MRCPRYAYVVIGATMRASRQIGRSIKPELVQLVQHRNMYLRYYRVYIGPRYRADRSRDRIAGAPSRCRYRYRFKVVLACRYTRLREHLLFLPPPSRARHPFLSGILPPSLRSIVSLHRRRAATCSLPLLPARARARAGALLTGPH